MTGEQIEAVLARVLALRGRDVDPDLKAVRTALLLEDAFDITLSDEEIDATVLNDEAAIRRLLAHHRVFG